jgi:hypothetical protein
MNRRSIAFTLFLLLLEKKREMDKASNMREPFQFFMM